VTQRRSPRHIPPAWSWIVSFGAPSVLSFHGSIESAACLWIACGCRSHPYGMLGCRIPYAVSPVVLGSLCDTWESLCGAPLFGSPFVGPHCLGVPFSRAGAPRVSFPVVVGRWDLERSVWNPTPVDLSTNRRLSCRAWKRIHAIRFLYLCSLSHNHTLSDDRAASRNDRNRVAKRYISVACDRYVAFRYTQDRKLSAPPKNARAATGVAFCYISVLSNHSLWFPLN
jgi:hypothetical protein